MHTCITCMFLLKLIILIPHVVSLSTGLTCDRTKQNPIQNDTSMAIVGCLNCRDCPPGYEPKVPCGKIIGIYDRIGSCIPCPDGMYSPNKDTKACTICQKKRCFKHQLFEGKCERDKHDLSRCLNKCEKGYKINKKKTACYLDASLMTMTTSEASIGSNVPKATPTMTSINTTKKLVTSHGQASSGANSDRIIVIVVAVIFAGAGAGVIAIAVWYCYRKWKRVKMQETDKNSASTEGLLDQSNIAEIRDESCKENSKPVASDSVKSPGMSPQNSNVAYIVSNENMPPPLKNDLVTFEKPVYSPADVFPAPLTQSTTTTSTTSQLPSQLTLIPNPLSSMYVPKNSNGNHMGRLNGDFPYEVYHKICEYFDTGTLGRDWRALACWLGLSVQEVERIKNQRYQTHEIIQIWAAKNENDLEKFLQILTDKKMTQLVAEINNELAKCRP